MQRFVFLFSGTALLFLIFLLYKFLTYFLIGYVFFQKEDVQLWHNHYFSIISFSGIVLFIPALFIFYVPEAYSICFYFSVFYIIFVKILIIYKVFTIFFQQKSPLFYYFLYLCAQELLPLFLVLKALVYFYSI
jgi:hypothetical protein